MALTRTTPALPVRDVALAAAFYAERLSFGLRHVEAGFAIAERGDAEIHLWAAADETWTSRPGFAAKPVTSGAESFLAGTASCRIETDDIDAVYEELSKAAVLHPTDRGQPETTEWSTREFATLDLDGNLLTFCQRL